MTEVMNSSAKKRPTTAKGSIFNKDALCTCVHVRDKSSAASLQISN